MTSPIEQTFTVAAWGHPIGPTGAAVDFDVKAFDALLADKGYSVTWECAATCPNRPVGGLSPQSHDINCTFCEGTGLVRYASEPQRMLVQAVRLSQQFYSYGRWDAGSVLVTARPGVTIGYWDRITLNNGRARFTELLRRGSGDYDSPKYKPLCLRYLAWVDRAKLLATFAPDDAVSIGDDGRIQWLGERPDQGSYYTVDYEYRPRYVLVDMVHQHRESTMNGVHVSFPVQMVGKADFLVRDEGKDAPQSRSEDPFRV